MAGHLPQVEQVVPGLWSVPVPVLSAALRYVLVYALESKRGLTLVDAGQNTDAAWSALCSGISHMGAEIADVSGVLVTHRHHDHLGLAGRVRETSGAWIAMHAADIEGTRRGRDETWSQIQARELQLSRFGLPDDLAHAEREMVAANWSGLELPDVALDDHEIVDLGEWRLDCVWTPGHTPGHVCFVEQKRELVFGGDHLLPRITPSVVVLPAEPPDPLGDFLSSLDRIARVTDGWANPEILPAHDYRYRGLDARLSAIREHHAARIAEIRKLLADGIPRTTYEIALGLTWSRPIETMPAHHRQLAASET